MPKYGIHHLVLSQAVSTLHAHPSSDVRGAADQMQEQRRWANLGAVGPDLFFWAPDYDFVKPYRLYQNIQEVARLYYEIRDSVVQAIETAGAPVTDTVDTLTPHAKQLIENLIEEIRETSELFKAAVSNGLLAGVLEGTNLLTDTAGVHSAAATFFSEVFTPGLQKGEPVESWYWFDMLHYRNTGDFARELVRRADGGTAAQRAYALGYLSHIATDVVGHPFVNQIAGGPYRLQVQRHVTAENYMDAWVFDQRFGASVNRTLIERLGFPVLDEERWQFDDVEPLDPGVRDLLAATFNSVFSDRPHPKRLETNGGFLTPGQIEETWEILVRVLNAMRYMTVERPEEPFTGAGDLLSDALADLFGSPPAPPGSPGGACSWEDILSFGLTPSSRDCYQDFFEDLADWLEYLGELLAWTFETLADLLDLILTLLLMLPIMVLMALLYGIQLLLWEIYQIARAVLALEGFVFPEPQDLGDAHARNLVFPVHCGLFGCPRITATSAGPQQVYPRRPNLGVSHLVCPPPVLETPPTGVNFAQPTAGPETFIQGAPFDVASLLAYANAGSIDHTRRLNAACREIGNASDFTAFMIATAADPASTDAQRDVAFTNWNLDGDRSYGSKTWRASSIELPGDVTEEGSVEGEQPV